MKAPRARGAAAGGFGGVALSRQGAACRLALRSMEATAQDDAQRSPNRTAVIALADTVSLLAAAMSLRAPAVTRPAATMTRPAATVSRLAATASRLAATVTVPVADMTLPATAAALRATALTRPTAAVTLPAIAASLAAAAIHLPAMALRASEARGGGRIALAVLAAAATLLAEAAQAEPVSIPLADGAELTAHWLPGPAPGPRPAVIALHGCGGLYRRDGAALQARYVEYTARLHAAGVHVLLPDSFGSRGSGPICTVRSGERAIGAEARRGDVLAALSWLRRRPEVDPQRIALLGWSHGASTLLAAVNAERPGHAEVAGAVAFYPGCRTALAQPFSAAAPLLLLLGADDDWTPPAPCEELVARTRRAQPQADIAVVTYPDSVHGFDSREPVRFRTDVPNGVNRAGVHQGGNPRARAAALAELDRFLARILDATPVRQARGEAP